MDLCTVNDLIDRIGERAVIQLTDDSTPPTAVNVSRCEQVISESSEVVKSRLAGRYKNVEALETTPLLKMLTLDIAAYLLYSRRNQGVIENVRQRYEDALKHLDCIKLNEATPPNIGKAQQEYVTNKTRSDRVFSKSLWERY